MADPINVDPNHYSVESENDQVRELRIRYGLGEQSEMHDHPSAVAGCGSLLDRLDIAFHAGP